MEKEKIKAVLDWPVPKSVKNIQKFLRLVNYYRRFIEGFVKIARPLCQNCKEWTSFIIFYFHFLFIL